MTRSLDNELLGDETQETDLCINKYECRNIFRYDSYLEVKK